MSSPLSPREPQSYPAVPPSPALRPRWADGPQLQSFAFYGGMAGGILILVGAFASAMLLTVIGLFGDGEGAVFFADADDWWAIALGLALWGLLMAGLVLLAALRIKENPDGSALPGLLMIVGGLLSFLALGGFLVGGLLAILGGVLAVAGARTVFAMRGPRFGSREMPPVT